MSLDPAVRERIDTLLAEHRVVLFMKGSPGAPQCGFSAKASGILSSLVPDYAHVDVLADPEIREGIKVYGSWPTIPQLYVGGELVGGSDIIEQTLNSGELHQLLGLPVPSREPPTLHISDAAADAIRQAMDGASGMALHLSIDPRFNAQFQLRPAQGGEIVAEANGIQVLLDLVSASRAEGLEIDWVEDVRGAGLSLRNPNAPPAVKPLSVDALAADAARFTIVDVRSGEDREAMPLDLPHVVLDADGEARLMQLDRATPLAFMCNRGQSSLAAAEHFRAAGFREVHNIEGGMLAWMRRAAS